MRVRCVADARAEAGESPVWSVGEQCLWWVDIWGRKLHRFDPSDEHDRTYAMPDVVAFAAPHAHGGLVVCLRSDVCRFDPSPQSFTPIAAIPLPAASRLNDAVIDEAGRLWVGSMSTSAATPDGALWRVDVDARVERVVDGLHSPNGLAFSPDGRVLYLADSHPSVRTVWAFDVDRKTGTLSRRRTFLDTRTLPGRPDGACVDAQGRYWFAAVDGSVVFCVDGAGRIVDSVPVPVEKPSKPAFGGVALGTLYITSLRRNLSKPESTQPLAGGLFAAAVGATGLAMPACRIARR